MKQAASARSIAGARADHTAGRSSIRRQGGDGDVNLADVWPTITRVGARRAEPEPEEGWRVRVAPPRDTRIAPLGSTQVTASERVRVAPRECWTALSYVYSESTATEGCYGTRHNEHNTRVAVDTHKPRSAEQPASPPPPSSPVSTQSERA